MELANVIFTLIFTALGIVAAVLKGVQVVVARTLENTLIREGLIRPTRRGDDDAADNWPNGWHSLPETLDGLYAAITTRNIANAKIEETEE